MDPTTITMADFEEITPWQNLVSLLVAVYNTILGFLKALVAPADYMPRLYSPREPVYFQALKRAPEDIITNKLTAEMRERQANGEHQQHSTPDEPEVGLYANEKAPVKSKRETETVSIRSFVEARCPSLRKGMLYFRIS